MAMKPQREARARCPLPIAPCLCPLPMPPFARLFVTVACQHTTDQNKHLSHFLSFNAYLHQSKTLFHVLFDFQLLVRRLVAIM